MTSLCRKKLKLKKGKNFDDCIREISVEFLLLFSFLVQSFYETLSEYLKKENSNKKQDLRDTMNKTSPDKISVHRHFGKHFKIKKLVKHYEGSVNKIK